MNNKSIIVYENNNIYSCKEECSSCNYQDGDNLCCVNYCKPDYFKELKQYCLIENQDCGLEYSAKANCISINKYTGIIQLKDGTYLEILPKLSGNTIDESRKIFENLVLASKNLTREYKHNKDVISQTKKNKHIIEILISVFCDDLYEILKKGIKKSYIRKSENLNKYKGKLNFAEHIKHNITNQSRFFVNYSELSLDIAENKILKTACLYLVKQTQSDNNKKILRRFLVELDDVSVSTNLEKNLQGVNIDRLNSYYERPLLYAEFFLRQQVFFPKKGRSKLPALLFPLEKMFEDYIESILKSANISYNSQYSSHYLLKNNLFQTKMDFVIFKDNKAIILDAKWKELDSTSAKFDVAQADLYQLFAYSELIKNNKAEVEEVEIMLLYPESNNFKEVTKWEYFNNTPVSIVPINVVEKENNPLFNKALAKILLN